MSTKVGHSWSFYLGLITVVAVGIAFVMYLNKKRLCTLCNSPSCSGCPTPVTAPVATTLVAIPNTVVTSVVSAAAEAVVQPTLTGAAVQYVGGTHRGILDVNGGRFVRTTVVKNDHPQYVANGAPLRADLYLFYAGGGYWVIQRDPDNLQNFDSRVASVRENPAFKIPLYDAQVFGSEYGGTDDGHLRVE